MTIAITAASGQLGRLVIRSLKSRVPAADLVALVRSPDKAADLGVAVREADYDRPESFARALAGVDTLLLISGPEVGKRVAQHRAVIDAARGAGVKRIVYTSALRADVSPLDIAPDHRATEAALKASGVPYTILRNGWYTENYTAQIGDYLARGASVGAAGDGRVSAASRADYAAAAAAVLIEDGHDNAIYELGGPAFSLKELAAVIAELSGTDVVYRDLSVAELTEVLVGAGLDESTARFVAALDEAVARGDLYTDSSDLARLIGRPATPLADVIRTALDSR
jgi:NAD(P)H dehydrogenase (quinone)